ncbi:hypothetical protein PVAP13_5KG568707 [Panicum virgatum]|uniref:Uncharacterized protein n=1 Tax=Panicum virgatum TaxID=38727 RepID=A0A8T0SVA8_PANVG|nr:hypothetical protein PVAP13_5KG568707 [Panicum virgatum]
MLRCRRSRCSCLSAPAQPLPPTRLRQRTASAAGLHQRREQRTGSTAPPRTNLAMGAPAPTWPGRRPRRQKPNAALLPREVRRAPAERALLRRSERRGRRSSGGADGGAVEQRLVDRRSSGGVELSSSASSTGSCSSTTSGLPRRTSPSRSSSPRHSTRHELRAARGRTKACQEQKAGARQRSG